MILFLAGFFIYLNSCQNFFAWDDSIVILENERVQKGISGIPLHFTKYTSDQLQDRYGYRPITLIAFGIEYSLFQKNPAYYHFINTLLFGVCCFFVFYFIQKLFPDKGPFPAFLTGLLFAIHPVHTEVVANIKSLDEILALLFGLVSLLFFLDWLREVLIFKKLLGLFLSMAFFAIAFLSKENSATLAGIWILLALLTPGLNLKKRIISLSPFLVAIVLVALIFWFAAANSTGKETTEGVGIVTEGRIMGNSIFYTDSKFEVAAFSFRLLLEYLKLFLFPWPLRYNYGQNQIPVVGWENPVVIISLLIHFILLGTALILRKKNTAYSFGILFYFFTIILYLHILKPLEDTLAERFLFMPSLGLCLAFIAVTGNIFKVDFTKRFSIDFIRNNRLFSAMIGLLCLPLVMLTIHRNTAWKDNKTLFSRDMPYLENCARAHFNYAGILAKEYQATHDPNILKELIGHYRKTISISDDAYYARLELALVLIESGDLNEGVEALENLQKKFPDEARPYFWFGYGKYHQGKFLEAIPHLEKARDLAPKRLDTYYYIAWSLYQTGRKKEAIQLMENRLAINPETLSYYDALSDFYFSDNQVEKGFSQLFKVTVLKPDYADAWKKIILRYYEGGDLVSARKIYDEALSKKIQLPAFEELMNGLSQKN